MPPPPPPPPLHAAAAAFAPCLASTGALFSSHQTRFLRPPLHVSPLFDWNWRVPCTKRCLLLASSSAPASQGKFKVLRRSCVSKVLPLHSSLHALLAFALASPQALPLFAVSSGRHILWRGRKQHASMKAFVGDANQALAAGREALSCVTHLRRRSIKHLIERLFAGPRSCSSAQRETWEAGVSSSLTQQVGLGMALLGTTTLAKDHISPVMTTLCANPIFMSGLLAWAAAQILKIFTTFFVERRWDFKMLLGSGGMPSSHSALCVALTTSVALCHGLSDALFPVCLGFSVIVMYDATGVRRHAGMQAEVLNMIVEDLFKAHPVSEKKLKELLGHTPLQVFAGALLGMLVGYLCSQGCPVVPGNGI